MDFLAFPPRSPIPNCDLAVSYLTKGFKMASEQHLYYLHSRWVQGKSAAFDYFEQISPSNVSYYTSMIYEIVWAPGTDNFVKVNHPSLFHAAYVSCIKSKVLEMPSGKIQQDAAAELIKGVIAHHTATLANWIYLMESFGWTEEHYRIWFTNSTSLYVALPLEFTRARTAGQQARAKWQAIADSAMSKTLLALELAVAESRPHYLRWLIAEGLAQTPTNSTTKLEGLKLDQNYQQILPYRDQTPENKKALDTWVQLHFKGQDADGIRTQVLAGLDSDYVLWLRKAVTDILSKVMSSVGSPLPAWHVTNKRPDYSKAATYWPQHMMATDDKQTVQFNPFVGTIETVVGCNPTVHTTKGATILVYSVFSKYLMFFMSEGNKFHAPKPDFSNIVENFQVDPCPNRGWRRPFAYEPPRLESEKEKKVGAAPSGAHLFSEWPTTFGNVLQLESAYQARLEVLDRWRDETRRGIEAEEEKKRRAIVWAPFNSKPKDLVEAAVVYGQRVAEWNERTKGRPDLEKLKEIQRWYADVVADLTSVVHLNINLTNSM